MDYTDWELDKNINHSFCTICGQRFGMSDFGKIKQYVNEYYMKKIAELQSRRAKLFAKVDEMKKEKIKAPRVASER